MSDKSIFSFRDVITQPINGAVSGATNMYDYLIRTPFVWYGERVINSGKHIQAFFSSEPSKTLQGADAWIKEKRQNLESDKENADRYNPFRSSESYLGDGLHVIGQFGVGFGVAGAAGKGLAAINNGSKLVKIGQTGQVMTKGVVAEQLAFSPYEERLANLFQDNDIAPTFMAYLAADPNDTILEARFKMALEGFALGMIGEGALKAIKPMAKKTKETSKDIKDILTKIKKTVYKKHELHQLFEKSLGQKVDELAYEQFKTIGKSGDVFDDSFTEILKKKAVEIINSDTRVSQLIKTVQKGTNILDDLMAETLVLRYKTAVLEGQQSKILAQQTSLRKSSKNQTLIQKLQENLEANHAQLKDISNTSMAAHSKIGQALNSLKINLDDKDMKETVDFLLQKIDPPKPLAGTNEKLYINSLLSSPKTVIKVITEATIMNNVKSGEQSLGGLSMFLEIPLKKAFHIIRKKGKQTDDPLVRNAYDQIRMGIYMYKALIQNAGESVLNARKFYKKKIQEGTLDTAYLDNPAQINKTSKIEKVTNFPSRLLQSIDTYFQENTSRAFLEAEGKIKFDRGELKDLLLSADEIVDQKTMIDRYVNSFRSVDKNQDGLFEFGEIIHKRANQFAKESILTQTTEDSPLLDAILEIRKQNPILSILFPFMRTGINDAREVIKRVPGLQFASGNFRKNLFSKDPFDQAQSRGQMIMGLGLIGLGAQMDYRGSESDKKNYHLKNIAGKGEYQLDFGNTQIGIDSSNFIKGLMSIGDNFANAQIKGYEDLSKKVLEEDLWDQATVLASSTFATGASALNIIADSSHASSVRDLIDLVQDPSGKSMQRFTKNKLISLVPAIVKDIRYAIDPYQRQVSKGIIDSHSTAMMNQLPFISNLLPKKYNEITGDVLKNKRQGLKAFIPYIVKTHKKHPSLEEMYRLNYALRPLKDEYRDIPLSAEHIAYQQKLMGQLKLSTDNKVDMNKGETLLQRLDHLVKSDAYNQDYGSDEATKEARKKLISSHIRPFRNMSLNIVRSKHPEIDIEYRKRQFIKQHKKEEE